MQMPASPERNRLVTLKQLAEQLGVAVSWLREEVRAKRLPYLNVGRRKLFNPLVVEQMLLNRAAGVVES